MTNKVVLTNEQFEEIERVVSGISRRKAWGVFTYEDLHQDLWLDVMELIEKVGEVPSLNLVARVCYNKVTDKIRYNRRRSDSQLLGDGTESNFEKGSTNESAEDFMVSRGLGGSSVTMSNLVVQEMMELFDEGTKERLYIYQMAVFHNALDPEEDTSEEFDTLFSNDKRFDNEIAINMGYSGSHSSGYKRVRWAVRERILEFNEWKSYKVKK